VRLQSSPPTQYRGPLDCFRQSLARDGFLSIYRGISAPLVGAALETSSLFFWERVGREALFKTSLYSREKPLPLSALWLTGAISGAFTSLVLTPVELVKCKIQVPEGSAGKAPTPLSVIREVFRHQGLKGFWNGQLGTLIRETGGCAAWFGSKETVTLLFRHLNTEYPSLAPSASSISPTMSSAAGVALGNALQPLPLWQQALAGASAGMSYNFLFFPADTIKSRMQTQATAGASGASLGTLAAGVQGGIQKKMTFTSEGLSIYRQYGLKGLYRGCGITVARSAPSSAFIFIIFDALKGSFGIS
jgi:ornithine carrier protein